MPLLGDLERFAATVLYPLRFVLAAIAIGILVVLVVVAIRRGWVAAGRRHPVRTGVLVALALIVLAPAAWYVGSPLVIRTELQEPPPAAGGGGATDAPSASLPLAPSSASGSPQPSAPGSGPGATAVATPVVRTGTFAGADEFHFGAGRATLTAAADGSSTLRFDNFSVRNGPDLYVYLSPDPSGYADGAIELARLRATDGSFNTPIPPGTDVSGVRSVVIWCREFAVLFAVATLDG
ncbi:MAG TPA: DM13 domain-containing protein [Candidatus Nanopelagicales bacterium]|nr:DM13 domain-containing protein [Candidatus Nanopelagicales bacterium]